MNNQLSTTARVLDFLRKRSVFVILLVIILLISTLSDQFLSTNNLLTVALQTSMIALAAIGMTFAIITNGIDLSVGPVAAICGALAAGLVVRQHIDTYPAMLIGLMAGCLLGAVNGAMIVWGRIPPFVATLATMAAARGLTLVYTQGKPIAGLDERFTFWGSGDFLGIPTPVVVLVIVALIAHFLLTRTTFGLHVYAVGGGEETSRLAGVPVRRVKFGAYILSGLCAALTGVLLTARLWSAQPNTGVLLELDAIAAAVLGGASLAGGAGSITGTIAGAFIIGVLSNGLNLLEVPSYNQQVVKGLVFILAVLLDYFLKQRGQASARKKLPVT
jgi:ribose transport system permease protein